MMMTRRLLAFALAAALGCGNSDDDDDPKDAGADAAVDLEGLQQCCHLGDVCHTPDLEGNATAGMCHDIGHTNDPAACRTAYAGCLATCIPDGGSSALPEMCEDPTDGDAPHDEG